MDASTVSIAAPADYLLHLADNALILGQRNAEWCGHGPVLEEDIALSNISLDLIGQARLLYQHAAGRVNADADANGNGNGSATEDSLAYFRGVHQFRNYTLLELPHFPAATGLLAATARADRDYATTITRNFLYSALMVLVWDALQASNDTQLAAIAAKSLKEVRYHLRHARDWLVRLGDGTEASRARMQAALGHLMPYTQEFWTVSPAEAAAAADGTGVVVPTLQPAWDALVDDALAEATLQRPPAGGYVPRGKEGAHSEHLGYVLDELQSLARQHPGASW
ncbi:MAG: phenylacetate-CoA oxygenase subunit PaaI [Betaproteobacteria bacterium HGW-Betaproteobacteria-3]|jgi:ring-1,2-phenylacetyl-CoA epoxidase subunit PaaC|nr:MAG: phenylacetate-CoA oxygenase subunit PaaI [Betaproteobacteria bacterium HGW-Betaproteobacteria-3]